jgi:hypothetical protein
MLSSDVAQIAYASDRWRSSGEKMQRLLIVTVLSLTALVGMPRLVAAEGALAVGTTGNVAADGMAIGGSFDAPSRDDAIGSALRKCRSQPDVRKAAARCKIVRTFERKCYAAAFDPKPGTTGAGWGLGPDVATATGNAMKFCRKSAGPERAAFCRIQEDITACDRHN